MAKWWLNYKYYRCDSRLSLKLVIQSKLMEIIHHLADNWQDCVWRGNASFFGNWNVRRFVQGALHQPRYAGYRCLRLWPGESRRRRLQSWPSLCNIVQLDLFWICFDVAPGRYIPEGLSHWIFPAHDVCSGVTWQKSVSWAGWTGPETWTMYDHGMTMLLYIAQLVRTSALGFLLVFQVGCTQRSARSDHLRWCQPSIEKRRGLGCREIICKDLLQFKVCSFEAVRSCDQLLPIDSLVDLPNLPSSCFGRRHLAVC